MDEEYEIIKSGFHHDIVEGSAYEIGKQQGEILKKRRSESVKWFTSKNNDPKKLGFKDFEELQAFYEEHCPGITDEFKGLADSFGIKLEELSLYGPPIYQPGSCSQIAITSSITDNNHVYVARSYEFHHERDDLRLCTARIKGKVKTIGFSQFALGRSDGLNDHGFCITLTGGGTFERPAKKKGFQFFLVTRALLDNCKSVAEAIERLEKMPINGYWNFLMTDKNSNAALAQFFDGEYAIKRISNDTDEKMIYSSNHYLLPEMIKYQKFAGKWILKNSKKRCEVINDTLSKATPKITKETIRDLLSKEIYDGLCGHYYNDYFGTLFSVIFDLTDLKADICFGVPTHNKWQKPFTLDEPVGVKEYPAVFPNKSITTDELWTGVKK